MVKVMVFGSFDRLHEGHKDLFRQAKEHGDELVVVVARDTSIRRLKGREPRQPEHERMMTVMTADKVDKAVLGHETDFFAVVEQERPDVLFLGYDQTTFDEAVIKQELKERGLSPEIKRGQPYGAGKYKSSKLNS